MYRYIETSGKPGRHLESNIIIYIYIYVYIYRKIQTGIDRYREMSIYIYICICVERDMKTYREIERDTQR